MRNPNILIRFQMNRLSFSSADKSTERQISVNRKCICGVCRLFEISLLWLMLFGSQHKSYFGAAVVPISMQYLLLAHKIFISNISLVLYRVNIRKTWHCHCTQHISSINDRDDNINNNNSNGDNVHESILFSPPQPSL